MNNDEILKLSIHEAHDALSKAVISVRDLYDAYRASADAANGEVKAYLEFYDAEEYITEAQQRYDAGTATLLTGMPIALKDNILITGNIASASSKILENHVAAYDADVVKNLKEQAVVWMGRTNMDEFAMGSSTENSAYGPTRNPLDTNRVPGGSSGGAAASVAMRGAIASLGTDTGGSIRQPASFCGLVGLYPTYGAVSRYGAIAMASSLDQIGPMTRTVAESEAMFEGIDGYTAHDAQSVPLEVREAKRKGKKAPKVIGVPRAFIDADGVSQATKDVFEANLEVMRQKGYEVVDVDLPTMKYSLPVYYVVMPAEVSSNLARFDGIRYGKRVTGKDVLETFKKTREAGFGPETKRRIMLGTYVLSSGYYDAYYGQAQAVRSKITKELENIFETVDLIATPTTPTGAFKIGEKSDPLSMYAADTFTVPANIAGMPAISVPAGKDDNGMPLGLQFVAPHFHEDWLFMAGKDFEAGV